MKPQRAPWLFLAPAIGLFVFALLIPMGYAIYLSFVGLRVNGGAYGKRVTTFVGFDNYVATLTDPEMADALLRLARFGIIAVPLTLGLALLFALLLDLPAVRLARFSRTMIFLPYAVPGVIATLMWGFMYLPSTSPFAAAFRAVGLTPPDFLGQDSIYGALANIAIWVAVGFNMIVMYTALRSVSPEMYEAARIDGATEFQIAVRIKIPLITPSLMLTFLFSMLATLQAYAEPVTLKSLTTAISFTFFPLMKIHRDAFGNDQISEAAAASVVLALGILVLSMFILRFLQRSTFEEEK